jgi:hypothetical protein
LTPKKNVILPDSAMKLYVTGGTFAFVEIEAPYRSEGHLSQGPCSGNAPHCDSWDLMFIRDLLGFFFPPSNASGDAHFTRSSDPPDFHYNLGLPLDLYLITDGVASLVLRPRGISGNSTYTAGGLIRARGGKLPVSCPQQPCDTRTGFADSYQVGGASFNAGSVGFAGIWAYTMERRSGVIPSGHASPTRTCLYPSDADPKASPLSQDHPFGCDIVPRKLTNAPSVTEAVVGTADEAIIATDLPNGVMIQNWAYRRRGLQYLGYHAGAIGPYPTVRGAIGIWHEYRIR